MLVVHFSFMISKLNVNICLFMTFQVHDSQLKCQNLLVLGFSGSFITKSDIFSEINEAEVNIPNHQGWQFLTLGYVFSCIVRPLAYDNIFLSSHFEGKKFFFWVTNVRRSNVAGHVDTLSYCTRFTVCKFSFTFSLWTDLLYVL